MASLAKKKTQTVPKKALEESNDEKSYYCKSCGTHFKTYMELTHQSPNHTKDICKKEQDRVAKEKAKAGAEKKAKLVGMKNKNKSKEQNRKSGAKNKKIGIKNNKKITGEKNISGEKNKPKSRKNRSDS